MLRVSEIYPSFQGEGPNTGTQTTFVRFAGCNLKCPGWSCDTQHAIDPKLFMKDSTVYEDMDKLVQEIMDVTPPHANVCLTGGEVMLQNAQDLEYVLSALHTTHTGVEIFTNGTFRMDRKFSNFFQNIIMDWKLPGTGEQLRPEWEGNSIYNLKHLTSDDAIKFTLANLGEDLDEAIARYRKYIEPVKQRPQVYVGAVWGKVSEAELASALLSCNLPFRLNVQVHKYIWDPDARRT